MNLHMIALTGGPCAGKSTALSVIEQRLTNLGYKVIILEEMATNVINSGIHPAEFGNRYQHIIAQMIKSREKVYLDFIWNWFPDDSKVVVISDRGLLDGMAYCDREYFEKEVLRKINMSVLDAMARYDGVFHLVTAAIGAEEFYTTANNKARMETVEEAADLDRRTLNCWAGHPHLRVISNNGVDFEGKMNNLMKEVLNLLGEPEPFEIERKFLIKKPSTDTLKNLGAVKVNIVQTYLTSQNGVERRVRQRGTDGNYAYYYTEKEEVSLGKRVEREKVISQSDYINLLVESDTSKRQIVKDRYCFIYEDRYFELDIYPFWEDQAILEIELASLDENINIPADIDIIKEVTGDSQYKNSSLASRPFDIK